MFYLSLSFLSLLIFRFDPVKNLWYSSSLSATSLTVGPKRKVKENKLITSYPVPVALILRGFFMSISKFELKRSGV